MDANWPELDRARRCGVKLAEDVTSFGAGRLGIWAGLEMGARSALAGWLAARWWQKGNRVAVARRR